MTGRCIQTIYIGHRRSEELGTIAKNITYDRNVGNIDNMPNQQGTLHYQDRTNLKKKRKILYKTEMLHQRKNHKYEQIEPKIYETIKKESKTHMLVNDV